MKPAQRNAVFLDRDGTLIVDVGYPREPDKVRLLPEVGAALRRLRSRELALVVISNQSGIGRGWVRPQEAAAVHARMVALLTEQGVALDGVYYCPHAPEAGCSCRKPSPGMLLQAARELGLNLASSFMVGDRASDVQAGQVAGCQTIQLLTAAGGEPSAAANADHVAGNWPEIVRHVLGHTVVQP